MNDAGYSLNDFFPFSPDVYFRLFIRYNEQWWPAHLVALAILAVILWQIASPRFRSDEQSAAPRIAAPLLGGVWLWVGVTFHIEHYANLNWAATYFGFAFIVQGLVILVAGITGNGIRYSPDGTDLRHARTAIVAFAVVLFPLVDPLTGQRWAGARTFGMMPDPTALGTLGLLLLAQRARWWLWVIPVTWCAIGGLTALAMNHPVGLVTPIVAVAAAVGAVWAGLRRAPRGG